VLVNERCSERTPTWKRTKALARTLFAATGIVALAGCTADGPWEAIRPTTSVDHVPSASAELSHILYERNLISNPEVNKKMNEAVLRITRDRAVPDSVIPEFLVWLKEWVSTHPAQVEAARLAGGPYTPEARGIFADTDSSRRSQTDSIRRLVLQRARRRIEAAHGSAQHR
jgi:hypothetical protein